MSQGFVYRFLQRGSKSVSLFHLFHLFIDWSEYMDSFVLVCLLGCWFRNFSSTCFSVFLINHFDRVFSL